MNTKSDVYPMDMQAAYVVTALAAALCKQPGIDGQKLRLDFTRRNGRYLGLRRVSKLLVDLLQH